MRTCAIVAALFVASVALAADDKPAIKEIPTKDLKINVTIPEKAKATEPSIVTSIAGLPKINPLTPDSVQSLRKQIDFEKEQVVVFWWAGSGQDKVTAGELTTSEKKTIVGTKEIVEKKTTVAFTYTPGRTRDLRAHFHLFVVPRGAEVKVEIKE